MFLDVFSSISCFFFSYSQHTYSMRNRTLINFFPLEDG